MNGAVVFGVIVSIELAVALVGQAIAALLAWVICRARDRIRRAAGLDITPALARATIVRSGRRARVEVQHASHLGVSRRGAHVAPRATGVEPAPDTYSRSAS